MEEDCIYLMPPLLLQIAPSQETMHAAAAGSAATIIPPLSLQIVPSQEMMETTLEEFTCSPHTQKSPIAPSQKTLHRSMEEQLLTRVPSLKSRTAPSQETLQTVI